MALRSILIVDDEEPIRQVLTEMLAEHGYSARSAPDAAAALRELGERDYDAVVTDVRMPGMDGLSFVRALQQVAPDTTVIVMSAYGSHDLALEAMKVGAYDYLGKPFRPDEVLLVLRKAEERERLQLENRRLRRELAASRGPARLVAESAAMKEMLRVVQKVAPAKTTVLVAGESGTGKELIARAVHELSLRSGGPFVPVNCGAIPAQLIESELFGHAKGAFTGAQAAKRGLFEEADAGTLFLDEIGELPLNLQVSLLRALQEGEIRRVGDSRSIKVDVRVIAATNRDLLQEVEHGRFREDLYYRLNVVALKLPPLRERPEEIPVLAARFLEQHAARLALPPKRLSTAALSLLQAWRWPGNVRELENALERALVLSEEDEIEPESLPEQMRAVARPPGPPLPPGEGDLSVKRAQRALEADLIRQALERTGGNRSRAAELLELSPRALLYKIRDYGLDD